MNVIVQQQAFFWYLLKLIIIWNIYSHISNNNPPSPYTPLFRFRARFSIDLLPFFIIDDHGSFTFFRPCSAGWRLPRLCVARTAKSTERPPGESLTAAAAGLHSEKSLTILTLNCLNFQAKKNNHAKTNSLDRNWDKFSSTQTNLINSVPKPPSSLRLQRILSAARKSGRFPRMFPPSKGRKGKGQSCEKGCVKWFQHLFITKSSALIRFRRFSLKKKKLLLFFTWGLWILISVSMKGKKGDFDVV